MTFHPATSRGVLAAAAMFALLACSSHAEREDDARSPVVVQRPGIAAGHDSLRAGDVRIVSPDSGIDLALLGDTISSGLSPYALAKVRHDTDSGTVSGTGFGASIEKMVKSKVADAVATRAAFPLSAVRDVRYEGGAIRFDWVGAQPKLFDHAKVNNKPLLESFRPEDAQRFVAAVKARKGAVQQ